MKIEDKNLDLDRCSLEQCHVACWLPSQSIHSVSPVMPDRRASHPCGWLTKPGRHLSLEMDSAFLPPSQASTDAPGRLAGCGR